MNSPQHPVIIIGAGQSGLAAARSARAHGLHPLVLEASEHRSGSWSRYYDSLHVFSPARYSAMPGLPFPGDPDRYPHRDEVVSYLETYADRLDDVEIRTGTKVTDVATDGLGFTVHTADGERLSAAGVVVASGSFGNPHRPALPGAETFDGVLTHVADYQNPEPYAGERVVVVGGGNSAIQIAHELAEKSTVTLARLSPPVFVPQVRHGHDLHHYLEVTGFDHFPGVWLGLMSSAPLVLDTGEYQAAYEAGRLDQRPTFSSLERDEVVWADGRREHVDSVILATGYRPDVGYLSRLGALDENGRPRHAGGISTTTPGLVYLGLEGQRSFASNTLRGVSRDADEVMPALAAYSRDAFSAIGL
ncbi:NAD(P)/FAD-dependent oxidoreductase [Nocardioides sp.]|uniref:flavin-containing monooxygenase n=1 Tax=Nocardioides sp. TaxID=35761 RepID=UPI002734C754|nr:NAD(P)/FAD-dependent oxidoreductase [Nocardioides sp.]MDP3891940.1 NAD(P)/FAD-dependent oxidoreductase [Nocardioides sp.]